MTVTNQLTSINMIYHSDKQLFFEVVKLITVLDQQHRMHQQHQIDYSLVSRAQLTSRALLLSGVHVVPLSDLDMTFAANLMQTFYRNEDRVWRSRGGRPGTETVGQFLEFVTANKYGHVPYGGVVAVLCDTVPQDKPSLLQRLLALFYWTPRPEVLPKWTIRDVVGYAVGEYVSSDSYEVVTAWARDEVRGIGLASMMYRHLVHDIYYNTTSPPRLLILDVLENSVSKMISRNPAWNIIHKLHADKLFYTSTPSYIVELDNGTSEKFERCVLRVAPLAIVEHISRCII